MDPNPWGAPPRAPRYRRAWTTYRSWSTRAQFLVAVAVVFVMLAAIGSAMPPADEIATDGPIPTGAPVTTAAPTTTTERIVTTTTAAPTTTTAAPTTTTAPPTTTTTAPPTTTTLPPTTTTAPPPPPPPPTTAATLPPTTAAPPPPPSDCHPNYDPCVPIASDVDCAGGEGDGPAFVDGPVYVKPGYSDPYGLDGNDNDGVGCES